MDLLVRALGGLLVVVVAVDVFRTVLLPSARGTTDRLLSRLLWSLARRTPRPLRHVARRSSGSLSLVLTPAAWYGALVLGFALVYLPDIEGLTYAPGVPFGDKGFAEALYLSGASLTTVGFGDVVGSTSFVRLTTVLQGACGLGVLTATLGYLPTIYSLVSDLRAANQAVADLGADEPDAAAELLGVDAVLVLDQVRRDVLATRQHLVRFPVLHTFHPVYDESVVALVRGATGLWVAGHFAEDGDRPLRRHVQALGLALARLTEELARHSSPRGVAGDPRAVLAAARAASTHPRAAREARLDDDDVERLRRILAVLDAYARSHDYPVATSLSPPAAGSSRG